MFKKPLQFPQQEEAEQMAGGIIGLALPFSPVTRPLGFLSHSKNLIRAEKTAAETRAGRILIGNQVGATQALGLASFYPSAGTKKLISGSGTVWKVYNPATLVWDNLKTGLTANKRFEAVTFDDKIIITNGTDVVQTWDGTAAIAALAGSPPVSPFIATGYRRVFLVTLPHQVHACDPADPTNWATLDSSTHSINAKDGDTITQIRFHRTNLYIWKRHSLHELHGPELGQVTKNWRNFKVADIGTPNGRTIVDIGGVLFWLSDSINAKGIVAFTSGKPELISDGIKGIIDRINWDAISTASAGTDGNGNYLLSVPLDSATTPTSTIVYCTTDGSWWLWDGWVPTVYGSYRLSADKDSYILGDNTGYVYSIGGTTDAGTVISYESVIGPAILGSPTQEKRVRRAYLVASAAAPASITVAASSSDIGAYGTGVVITPGDAAITRIKKYLPLNSGEAMGGYLYRLKLTGSGQVKFFEVGFEVGLRRV